MTVRQRQAPGTATAHVANGSDLASDRTAQFSWEDWFRHASPQQRSDALGLAHRQGLLYPHQLPAVSNGVKPASAGVKDADPPPHIVRLLAGKADTLPCLQLEVLTFIDDALDELQRQAVTRAISTPDLLLMQGLPGTGKSRVLTEVLLQAASRGWRVLFLAGQTASLDVILHRLTGRGEIFGLRFLDANEKPESLPTWLRAFTLDNQRQTFLAQILAGARANHEQAKARCGRWAAEESLWSELQACAELDAKFQVLQSQLAGIDAEVERDADAGNANSPWACRLAELRQARDQAARELESASQGRRETLAKCDQEVAALDASIAALQPAYRAKKNSKFWTIAFWSNLFNGSIVPAMDQLLAQHAKAATSRQEAAQQLEQANHQLQARQQQFADERKSLLAAEAGSRREKLTAQMRALESQSRQLTEQLDARCERLRTALADRTPAAVAAAHQAWLKQKKADEQHCHFAQQWSKFVEDNGHSLTNKLPNFANVLAGSILRWHTDAKFRDALAGPVDLLIIEDAAALTEADLLKLSRHARRAMLVGEALAEPTPAPSVAEKASRALLAAPLVSAACWQRLWQTLGGDAGRWPCTWHRDQGRLVCQLLPLTAEDRKHLEIERLADAPDIELRILHRPRTQPKLAEVIFAEHCKFEDAFAFMVGEVQEFPLEPIGHCGWWSDEPLRFCRHLGPNAGRIHAWVTIEPGIKLGTVPGSDGDATLAACIEFDKSAGWDRDKADAWLDRHRTIHDHERTIHLQTPYRFEPHLASIVASVVRDGDWLTSALPGSANGAKTFEFIPVPPMTKPDWPREGAGLELDLTAHRQADRLPAGLRQGLPARGYVNYLEAQALVRRLETWLTEDGAAKHRIAVLALYEGQVELLRRLIAQSEVLRARDVAIEVALPSRLHQRECDAVFLSLTRSHAHRCVAFGEDVKELPLALTRSRSRLFLFGDPGSMSKRSSWHGPLDQLDAASAHQELVRLSRLLTYLQCHVGPGANGAANGK